MDSKKGIVDRYLYIKICIDSVYNHISFWASLLEKIMVGGIFIKVFNITNYWLIGMTAVIGLISLIYFGHLLLKKGIIERQTSMLNQYNPELQKILKKIQ